MRQRGFLLILAATALGSLLAALSLHQALQSARVEFAAIENSRKTAEDRTLSAVQEADRLKAAAGASDALAKKLETSLLGVGEKLDRLEKDLVAREQARETSQTQIQARVTELGATVAEVKTGLADVKAQMTAQGAGLTQKLDEVAKARDLGTQLTGQIAALEAKLREKEAQLLTASTERDRNAEDLKRRQASVERLERELESERSRPKAAPQAPRVENRAPPAVPVTARISAVEPSGGVVVLGTGKKSGLETGHVLFVSRDGKPIARVRVIKLYDDLAGAEILETEPGETVKLDDRASTDAPQVSTSTPTSPLPLTKRDPPPPPPGGNSEK